jgi:hypothetical protein
MPSPPSSSFYDINNTSLLLPLFNAVLVTDMSVILLSIFGIIASQALRQWYATYNLSAVISDVFVIVLAITLARFVYPYVFGTDFSLLKFTGLSVAIQMIHDVLFYYLFKAIPQGSNRMMDTFKHYAKEVGVGAILSDSAMVIASCVLSYYFTEFSTNTNAILLIALVYLVPYLVYQN